MWSTQQFLLYYGAVVTDKDRGRHQPLQFDHLLRKADVSTEYGSYLHTFSLLAEQDQGQLGRLLLHETLIEKHRQEATKWLPKDVPVIKGVVPPYCKVPNEREDEIMQVSLIFNRN
jgi:hypothetical protein